MTRCVLASVATLGLAQTAAAEELWWPQFRGPGARGVAQAGTYPVHFGPDVNLVWRTPLPIGQSSPCIWRDRIFLTGRTEGTLEALCLDRASGRILWRRPAPTAKLESFESPGGPAAVTPTTDGQHVYVYFGSYGLTCYDFDGNVKWTLPLPAPITGWGSAASPILAGELVVLKRDQDVDSHVLAVNRRNGKVVWRAERPGFRRSYGTPIVWRHDDIEELVVPGALALTAYDLSSGHERWTVHGLPADMCTTPTVGNGLLYVAAWGPGAETGARTRLPPFEQALTRYDKNGDGRLTVNEAKLRSVPFNFDEMDLNKNGWVGAKEWASLAEWYGRTDNGLLAIRPGGRGNITTTHVAWKQKRALPYVPSPLHYRDRVYLVKDGGIVSCFEAERGTLVFQGRLGPRGKYHASPVAGDGKIYVASRDGVVTVFEAADPLRVLARNDFGEAISATPALVDSQLYLRTERALYAFGR